MSKIYEYEIKEDASLRILSVFQKDMYVEIPRMIDGHVVSEIADYCFSKKSDSFCEKENFSNVYQQCYGLQVEEVVLPDTVQKIGSYAFYNCRNLKCVQLSKSVVTLGSDVFMNCMKLHTIQMDCSILEATCLKQVLAQITWDIEIQFQDYAIFYPEYEGAYAEVGPAHIFALNIEGEGFRMRQCFKNGRIALDEYDACFETLCVQEEKNCVCKVMSDRMRMNPDLYIKYAKKYKESFVKFIMNSIPKKKEIVKFGLKQDFINQEDLEMMIVSERDIEQKMLLIELKQAYFKDVNAYSFEDF